MDLSRPKTDDRVEQIRIRAYELYLQRGGTVGKDLDDWLAAEREIDGGSRPAQRPAAPPLKSEAAGFSTNQAPSGSPPPADEREKKPGFASKFKGNFGRR